MLKKSHDLVEKLTCDLNFKKCALNQCGSCSSNNFRFGLKKDYSNSEPPESEEETDGDEGKYFPRTKIENRITKAIQPIKAINDERKTYSFEGTHFR